MNSQRRIKSKSTGVNGGDATKAEKKKHSTGIDFKSMLIGILGAGLVMACIYIYKTDTDPYRYIESESIEETMENSYDDFEMTDAEVTDAKDKLISLVTELKENNGYVHVYTDEEDYDTYIYNKNGEIFCASNDGETMEVYRNDGNTVVFSDSIYVTEDIDILSIVLNSLNAIDNDDIKMYVRKSTVLDVEDYQGYQEYTATFDSYDKIAKFYSSESTDLQLTMLETIQEAFDDDVVPTFKLDYIISDDGGLTVACYLYQDDTEYINWYFDGYLEVYDWELDDEWYTYDFSDSDTSEEMLETLVEDIETMLSQFAEENPDLIESVDEEEEDTSLDTDTYYEDTATYEYDSETSTTDSASEDETVYTYDDELDLSSIPNLTLEEAQEMLENADPETSNIDKLQEITDN